MFIYDGHWQMVNLASYGPHAPVSYDINYIFYSEYMDPNGKLVD